uniref:Zinc finger HIT-type containing 2 n=1 Tax=Strix occidentalis caurina TaxID=311401 RepID=A0A8D0FM22_STROC
MAAPSAEAPCGLCGAAAAPYTCPRCNRRLCSLRCYRGHGACAEAFYRQQVLQTLEAERGSPPDRTRLASTFHRLLQLREAEDPARPAGPGLSAAAFERWVSSGEAAEFLPPWRPWWWRRRHPPEELEPAAIGPAPPLPAALPPLRTFRAAPPSPLLPFQLPNVLYGYAFALSLHAGDESLLPDLPAAAVAASAALRARRAFSSVAEALLAARRDAAAAGYPRCPLGDAGVVLAVAELLEDARGRDVAAALGHLEGWLGRSRRGLAPESRSRFANARRKCRYLRAWSQEAPEALGGLAAAARSLHGRLVREEEAAAALGGPWPCPSPPPELISGDENEGGGGRLIQELD